jgi:hypothetical protein
MNKSKAVFILMASLFLFSCGGTTETKEESNNTEELSTESYEGMTEVNLSEFGLEATIQIPDESKGKAEITETSFGSIQIVVGQNYGIEIVPFGLSIDEKKEELAGDLVYNVEYLTENPTLIEFKRTIKESDVEEEYHFFMSKELNGEVYEIKSISEMSFKKFALKSMVNSAKSLKMKNPA